MKELFEKAAQLLAEGGHCKGTRFDGQGRHCAMGALEASDTNTRGLVDSADVGQVAAKVRKAKPAEPYKGKGIKYASETVRRKEGKKK